MNTEFKKYLKILCPPLYISILKDFLQAANLDDDIERPPLPLILILRLWLACSDMRKLICSKFFPDTTNNTIKSCFIQKKLILTLHTVLRKQLMDFSR